MPEYSFLLTRLMLLCRCYHLLVACHSNFRFLHLAFAVTCKSAKIMCWLHTELLTDHVPGLAGVHNSFSCRILSLSLIFTWTLPLYIFVGTGNLISLAQGGYLGLGSPVLNTWIGPVSGLLAHELAWRGAYFQIWPADGRNQQGQTNTNQKNKN